VENFEKALIQRNNARWIMQKVSEGGDRPKSEINPETIKFVKCESRYPVAPTGSLISALLVDPSWVLDFLDPSDSEFHDACHRLAELLRNPGSSLNRCPETHSECYSCKQYTDSPYLKCAVNPARTTEEECRHFERA
jgi:hypothetical protein